MYRKEYLEKKSMFADLIVEDMGDGNISDSEINESLERFENIDLDDDLKDTIAKKGNEFFESGVYIKAPAGKKYETPFELDYKTGSKENEFNDNNLIIAEKDSELNLVVDYNNEDYKKVIHNGLSRIIVKENAVVNFIKIQRLNDKSQNFDLNLSVIENDGEINWITVELGARETITKNINILKSEGSKADIKSIYFGDGERKLDLDYTVKHFGRHSKSEIESRGVLKDKAKKIFRGNLHFKKEAKAADGSEKEHILLMDKRVESDSIPALFTEEDNVQGEHAVSAGQIDENSLFYLMSRGFTKVEAKKLLVEAAFNPIFEKIPLNDLKGSVMNEVKRKLE